MERPEILVTGATGFVGSAVRPALAAAGWRARCLTRDADRARARQPHARWVQGDVADEEAACARSQGCRAALYLVHCMGEGRDFRAPRGRGRAAVRPRRRRPPASSASSISAASPPSDGGSAHLRSRARRRRGAARRRRAGDRAARQHDHRPRQPELAHRARSGGAPAGDGAAALARLAHAARRDRRRRGRARARARRCRSAAAPSYDLPGPQMLSGREILEETALMLGLPQPHMVEVPLLTPRLSSLWVRFVTRARWSVARELVLGLTSDLLAARRSLLARSSIMASRVPFGEAARRALAAERARRRSGRRLGTRRAGALRRRAQPDVNERTRRLRRSSRSWCGSPAPSSRAALRHLDRHRRRRRRARRRGPRARRERAARAPAAHRRAPRPRRRRRRAS